MAKLEESAECGGCGRRVLARTEYLPHLFFLILTALTGGLVGMFWAVRTVLWRPRWLCSRCGSACDGPRHPAGHHGWWVAAAIWIGLHVAAVAVVVAAIVLPPAVEAVASQFRRPATPVAAAVRPADEPPPARPAGLTGGKGQSKGAGNDDERRQPVRPADPAPVPPAPAPEPNPPLKPDPVPEPKPAPEPAPAPKPAAPEPPKPVRPADPDPWPAGAEELFGRGEYLFSERPADLESYRRAGPKSPLREAMERQGRVVVLTAGPVVTVVRERDDYPQVLVLTGPLAGKQAYLPADHLKSTRPPTGPPPRTPPPDPKGPKGGKKK